MGKHTLEAVKLEFLNRGFTPLFSKYGNSNTKLLAMTKEGYKFTSNISNLKNDKVPHLFSKFNINTIDNIKLFILLNDIKNVQLISTIFENSSKKLIWFCNVHKIEYYQSWNKFRSGCGCKLCGFEAIASSKKFTIEEVNLKNNIINPNIEILSNSYSNAHTILTCTCRIHGGDLISDWNKLSKGHIPCKSCYLESKIGENNHNYGKNMRGENSPTWKGGITPLMQYLREEIRQWKYDSFNKGDNKCAITSGRKNLEVHHIKMFSEIVYETLELLALPKHQEINLYSDVELELMRNKCLELHYHYGLGIVLSREEHKLFHDTYGRKNNTKEQLSEFLLKRKYDLKTKGDDF